MNYDIDWECDGWFAMNHAANLTPEFKLWWLDYYGYPREYDKSQGSWVSIVRAAPSLLWGGTLVPRGGTRSILSGRLKG